MSMEAGSPDKVAAVSESQLKRRLIWSMVIAGIVLLAMIALLVFLGIDAYHTAPQPSPGAVVVSLLRDAAIIMVAFEALIIGVLLIILTLQVQALVSLLRDEIRPMLQSVNETVSTVRGTAQFMSHNIVTPTIRAAVFVAGVRRALKEVSDLFKG